MLELTDVSVHYGRVAAVQALNLSVSEGEFVGLVGHNGAGKSTTLWAITGVLKPASGEIRFEGKSIKGLSPDAILRRGIALVPENRRIFGRLSVGENLRIGAAGRKDRKQVDEDIKKACERFEALGTFFDRGAADALRRRAAAARDRPGAPLAAQAAAPRRADARARPARRRSGVRHHWKSSSARASTILLVEQNAARTIEVADRTYVMRSGGRIAFQGTAEQLAEVGDFETAYIGLG